jgi:hypothetical protein
MELKLQLHGGGGGGGGGDDVEPVKSSAPGSSAVATIDNATEGERQRLREQLSSARGRRYTNKTGNTTAIAESFKKVFLGE